MKKKSWNLVKEKLPEIGKIVIISDGRSIAPGFRNPDDNGAFYYLDKYGANICFIIPLLWQELPDLPKNPMVGVDIPEDILDRL